MVMYPVPPQRTLFKYNLTADQWWQLFGDGHCPLCGKKYRPDVPARRAVVDHEHMTGEVRGMLCAACNYEIGCLFENVEWMEAAACYLRHPTTSTWDKVPRIQGAPPRKEES